MNNIFVFSALSVFALHPIYIHLPRLIEDPRIKGEIEKTKKELNALPRVDYELVMATKLKFLKQIYNASKSTTLGSPKFEEWKKANLNWLAPYALYCVLKAKYATHDWNQWKEYAQMNLVVQRLFKRKF